MEIDAIKKLIETDEKTRDAVQAQYQKRNDLKREIEEQKKKLSQEAWDNVNQQVADTKKELDAKIASDAAVNDAHYKTLSKALLDSYQANKETWRTEIVDRIVHGEKKNV